MGRWNTYLEARFPLKLYRHAKRVNWGALGKRVAADQFLMCVVHTSCAYLETHPLYLSRAPLGVSLLDSFARFQAYAM
jgi:hypothetical protein